MSCADASCEVRSSLTVRIRGDSRDPGSTPCAFADLIQEFQTTPSVGGLVRPSTTAKTQSIWWVFALSIGVPKGPNEIALAAEPLIRSGRSVGSLPGPRIREDGGNGFYAPRVLLPRESVGEAL